MHPQIVNLARPRSRATLLDFEQGLLDMQQVNGTGGSSRRSLMRLGAPVAAGGFATPGRIPGILASALLACDDQECRLAYLAHDVLGACEYTVHLDLRVCGMLFGLHGCASLGVAGCE